jgi:hypothetical protein
LEKQWSLMAKYAWFLGPKWISPRSSDEAGMP